MRMLRTYPPNRRTMELLQHYVRARNRRRNTHGLFPEVGDLVNTDFRIIGREDSPDSAEITLLISHANKVDFTMEPDGSVVCLTDTNATRDRWVGKITLRPTTREEAGASLGATNDKAPIFVETVDDGVFAGKVKYLTPNPGWLAYARFLQPIWDYPEEYTTIRAQVVSWRILPDPSLYWDPGVYTILGEDNHPHITSRTNVTDPSQQWWDVVDSLRDYSYIPEKSGHEELPWPVVGTYKTFEEAEWALQHYYDFLGEQARRDYEDKLKEFSNKSNKEEEQ